MLTQRIYLEDTYQKTHESHIIGQGLDEKGPYIILDETIFHPQGGGQPSDVGVIKTQESQISILAVRIVGEEIRHYVSQILKDMPNEKVMSEVDMKERLRNARYHSAGHLISQIIESSFKGSRANKGHHFPGEAYVEFSHPPFSIDGIQKILEQNLANLIAQGAATIVTKVPVDEVKDAFPYLAKFTKSGDLVRMISIAGHTPAPCNGTHVSDIQELGKVRIENCRIKNGSLRVRYEID